MFEELDNGSDDSGSLWLWVFGASAFALLTLGLWKKKPTAGKRPNSLGYTPEVADERHRGLLPFGHVSSAYGMRQLAGQAPKMHQGVDIAAPRGTAVRAAQAGIVTDLSPNGTRQNYGNTVILEHADGSATLYAHLDRFFPGLRVGDVVQQGQTIGYVGNTESPRDESSMAPHLHFEAHVKRVMSDSGRTIVNPDQPDRFEPIGYLLALGRTATDEPIDDGAIIAEPIA